MFNTSQFNLPLLQAAQAQKHVTVNEALAKLDALCQLRFKSRQSTNPPSGPIDGDCYLIPFGAAGDWATNDERIAVFSNGGWTFLTPKEGWQAYVEDEGKHVLFDGSSWQVKDEGVSSLGGASSKDVVLEFDHIVAPGASNTSAIDIPANVLVQAVTARVLTTINAGTATNWRLGVSGADDRYGSGLGLSVGSYALGLTGSPQAYYSDTGLQLTAEGDDFVSGTVRICIHYSIFTPPS